MAIVRHVKVTLRRAKNINACTVRKASTMVTATASYKDLLYTANMTWDGILHGRMTEPMCFISTSRTRMGTSPWSSSTGTTTVLEYRTKTTKISAKLIYKHTTHKSGVLENMGNKFVWHEDNTFTFMINSLKPDDILKIEVYNTKDKVGECEIRMSLFIEQEENHQGVPSELVSQNLYLNRGSVGNIEVTACFNPKPVTPLQQIHQSSFLQTQQHPSGMPQHPSTSAPCYPPTHTGVHPSAVYSQAVPQFHPSVSLNHRPSAPSAPSPESLYPSVPGHVHLNPSVSFNPRAPAPRPELYSPPGPICTTVG